MECLMISTPPSLLNLLTDPEVTDICLNGAHSIKVNRGSGFEDFGESSLFQNEDEYRQFVLEHLSLSGKTWDAKLPFVDTVFFNTHRAHLVFPPVARMGICVSLRKLPRAGTSSASKVREDSHKRWAQDAAGFHLLSDSILKQESILFCGATGSGKTTLFNDLLAFIPKQERLIALEDTAEINPAHPHFLSLLSRPANADGFGAVTLRDLVRQTLRMKPDRILIGECRGDEVLDLLLALNTGHRGTLTTLHANSAVDGLRRLELLALIASKGQIPSPLIRSLIAKGFQKVAFLDQRDGQRRISEIISVEGLERDVIVSRKVFPKALDFGGDGSPPSGPRERERAFPRSGA